MTGANPDGQDQTPSPDLTARSLLVQWANEQDGWVRLLVADVLTTRQPAGGAAVEAAYNHLLAEKGLAERVAPVATLDWEQGELDPEERLSLSYLRGVTGVNALAPDQEVEFHPCLTVLFGENAAGKTGYVRILKRLAAVRGAEAILSNVHGGGSTLPAATIGYRVGDADHELEWRSEDGVPPFSRMSVFDSGAVDIHLNDGLTYVYTPGDLALFGHIHAAVEAVKVRLERAVEEVRPRGNPFLARLPRGSRAHVEVETLGAATDVTILESLARIPQDDIDSLDDRRARVEALRPQSLETSI